MGKFIVDVSKGTGVATGEGTIKYSIEGFCMGGESLNYTYNVVGAIDTRSNNLTLAFEPPTPDSSVVTIVCNGQQGTVSYSWTAAVPVIVSLRAAHGASIGGKDSSNSVVYSFTIE